MELLDTASIFRFHKHLISQHGEGSTGALGWKSDEAQLARYAVLAEIADLNDRSVIDLGCGHGDLRNFLGNIYPRLRYFGVEKIPALLDIAIERYSHLPETLFFEGDFSEAELPTVDYIIACGSLSYRNSDPLYIFKMIERLFRNCRMGFAFNLLSSTEDPDGIITGYNPAFIMDYCGKLTSKISLRKGYWENDYTVMMYH
jgi:SAM-dependent methyltransferase